MPTFLVPLPDGRRLKLTGETMPSDDDIDELIASLPTPAAERPPSAGEQARASITAEIDRKTAEAAPNETWGKAQMAGAAAMGRAVTDTIQGGARLIGLGDAASKLLAPMLEPIEAAEFAADEMKGNETLAAVGGAIGSGVGSAPFAMVPGGAVVSAGAAGLQGFESTRREALKLTMQAGIAPDEAEKIADRVGLQAGVITGAVTGAFNRYGGKIFGRGVERGLSSAVRELTAKELQRSAALPIVKAVVKEALGEGAEEATDKVLQETITRWQYDPSTSLEQYAKRALRDILKAGALGAVAGGVVGGGGAAAQVVGERRVAVARLRAGDQGPVTGVPGDTSALATPMRIPEPTESADGAPTAPTAAPGTYAFGTLPDGREVNTSVPPGGDVEAGKEYLGKVWPEAQFSRVEVVASPEVTAPPQGAEATAEPGGAMSEASSVPAQEAPPASAQEGVTPNEEEGQGQEILTPPDAAAASTPAAPPKRRRIARAAIGDILDDLEQAGGLMSATEAEKKGVTVGPEWDDAPQGLPVSHRFVYGNGAGGKGTLTPDKALQALQMQSPERYGGMNVPEMWAAIEAASKGRVAATKRRKAEIAETKAAVDWQQSALEPGAGTTDGILAGDLGVGEVLTVDGEKVRVSGYDREGNVILDDGKRFGRQRVDGNQVIYVEKIEAAGATGQKGMQQSPDAPFSIGATPARPSFREKLEEQRRRWAEHERAILDGANPDGTITLQDPTRPEHVQFISKNPSKPGWRITRFINQEPVGHLEFPTREAAIQEMVGTRMRPAPQVRFSIGQQGFFDAPESVDEQKARMAREAAARKKAEDRQKMLDRQAAPLRGRAVDTTGDMFDTLASEAPLFATRPPTKPTPAKGAQGELFSVAPEPEGGMSREAVLGELGMAFGGKIPSRIKVSNEAPRVGGGVTEAMLDKPTGIVTIFAPNLSSAADVRRVTRHEFLHDVFDDGRVQGAWRTLRTFLTGADQARVRGEGYTENVDEEALIDEIEARVDRQASPFRRFVGQIVGALYRRGRQDIAGALFGLDHLADADARALVGYAMRVERMEAARGDGGTAPQQRGTRLSLGLDLVAGKVKYPEDRKPTVFRIAEWFQSLVPSDKVVSYRTATPEQNARIESEITEHIIHAYELHPEAAGWYRENVALMMRTLVAMDPSLSDPSNEFIFKAILAVTSDGNEVGAQFDNTWAIWSEYKRTGQINPALATGKQRNNIAANLETVQHLIDHLGPIAARNWLTRKSTLSAIRQAAQTDLGLTKKEAGAIAAGELKDTVLPHSVIFGPKLGSFFNNLYGDFSTVTMDRWFMRTIGRITGTQVRAIPASVVRDQSARIRKAWQALSPEEKRRLRADADFTAESMVGDGILDSVAGLVRFFGDSENRRGSKAWGEFRKASNRLQKTAEPLVEAPANGGHRQWIRARMQAAQATLSSKGIDLNAADIQALLWYLEKEIYEATGYKSRSGAADYASAAERLHARLVGRPSGIDAEGAGRVGRIGRAGKNRRSNAEGSAPGPEALTAPETRASIRPVNPDARPARDQSSEPNAQQSGQGSERVDRAFQQGGKVGHRWQGDFARFLGAVGYGEADLPPYYDDPTDVRAVAWEAGFLGKPKPRWVRAERVGKLPATGRSFNFREQKLEPGVSVLRIEGQERTDDGTFLRFNDGPREYVEGWLHFKEGTDGEPLLVGAVRSQNQTPFDSPAPSAQQSGQGSRLSLRTLWRAGDADEVGIKPWASFTEDKATAEAYLDNPGFGGETLRSVEADINPDEVLNADTRTRRGMQDLAAKIGLERDAGEEWFDNGWRYPWEESKSVKDQLRGSGFKWLRYVDDFPEGASTIIRIVPFDSPAPSTGADTRLSIRNVPADQLAAEPERQKQAGVAPTVISSELAWDGARVMAELNPRGFESWRDAMLARHGETALPFLSRAWQDALDVRYSLANGIPPQVQDDINRIESAAEAAPRTTERKPVPAYDPTKVKEWWHGAVRPSDVIRYFGGDDLLRKKNLLDLRTAYQQAAVQEQSRRLTEALEDSFYGDHAGPILRALRRFMPRERFRRFMRHALPIAAHLNVTGGTSGAWTFADFDQRAGFMPESEANRHGITSGDSIMRANPVTGALETLVLGPKMTLEKGPKGFQILRRMSADRQAGVYEWARTEFPEFMWFLDTWLDPRLKDTRVEINGVELPIFNRWALATRYAQADPKFVAREAYTPDVSIGAGLLGAMKRQFRKERKWSPRDGTVSPGRKYETGSARESGDVLDLLSGFNVRAMQVLQEDVRKQWAKDVLASAADVPPEGLPESWVPIETAMDEVWRAVQAMQKFDDPLNFPSVTDRLRDDDSPEYKKFFGELTALRRANTPKMVPRPLVEALRQDMASTKELGLVGEIFRWWARNWKASLLLMPDTFIENRTDNYLRLLMQSYRQLILSAMRGGDRQTFSEAKNLAWAAMAGVVPGIRQLTGLNRNRLFNETVRSALPPELFSSGHKLADLWIDRGGLEEEIASDIATGRRGRAAWKAFINSPAVVLEKSGYSDMDVTAKQQFAFATLLSAAEAEGRRRGLHGDVFEQFVEAWVKKPPEAVIRRAVEGANRLLLNYNDTPGWLAKLARNPVSNLLVAFPLFRYHFVGREIDRAASALRAFLAVSTRGKKLTRDQWAAALADTISYITLPLVGYAGVKVAGALADSLIGAPGGDDDDDPRNVVGSGVRLVETPEGGVTRKPLARELVTANRINLSAIMRQMGVDTGNPNDYWWHAKDYPIVRSVALVYQAMEDTRRHGPTQGLVSLFGGLKEFLGSIAGVGQVVKVPAKIAAEIEGAESGRPAFTGWDPYATGVPLDAYLTMQALNLIPGQRQANEVMKWLDPTPRRMTRSKALDYDPGVKEALQAEGWTGLADRMARLAMTGDAASPLPPQGTINRRTGTVDTPRTFDLKSRIAALLGQNIKPVPRDEYRDAVEAE